MTQCLFPRHFTQNAAGQVGSAVNVCTATRGLGAEIQSLSETAFFGGQAPFLAQGLFPCQVMCSKCCIHPEGAPFAYSNKGTLLASLALSQAVAPFL